MKFDEAPTLLSAVTRPAMVSRKKPSTRNLVATCYTFIVDILSSLTKITDLRVNDPLKLCIAHQHCIIRFQMRLHFCPVSLTFSVVTSQIYFFKFLTIHPLA